MPRHHYLMAIVVIAASATAQNSSAIQSAGPVQNATTSPKVTDSQDTSVPNQADLMNKLLDRVKELEARVAQLEALQAGITPPVVTTTQVATVQGPPAEGQAAGQVSPSEPVVPAKAQTPSHDSAMAGMGGMGASTSASQDATNYPNLHFRGFADVDFYARDHKLGSSFFLGQFAIHMASQLSPKIFYFGEFTMDATFGKQFLVDLQRSFIRYDFNDNVKLSFGKFHTPISFWNTAYHHGFWLQTSVFRPDVIQFGGTLIPVHFVGVQAEGKIPSGPLNPLGLQYNAIIGNGRGFDLSRGGELIDANNNRAWAINIYSRPIHLDGFEVGGATYHDLDNVKAKRYREFISSAHIAWTNETPEIIAEFFNINHRATDSAVEFNTQAFYVQGAYRLPFLQHQFKPYYRFEYTHTPRTEPVFGIQDLVASSLGVRWDVSEFAAFKAEYRHSHNQSTFAPNVNNLFLQTAFTF